MVPAIAGENEDEGGRGREGEGGGGKREGGREGGREAAQIVRRNLRSGEEEVFHRCRE